MNVKDDWSISEARSEIVRLNRVLDVRSDRIQAITRVNNALIDRLWSERAQRQFEADVRESSLWFRLGKRIGFYS